MSDLETLSRLSNFNLIKYFDHYVLTIDKGIGKPIIFEGDTISDVVAQLTIFKAAL